MTSDDHSVHISGHANVRGQVGSGEHVTQTQHIAAADSHLAETFDRLERLLDEHAAELAESDTARRDLADIRAEAGERAPDRDRISDSLNRLAHRVAAVGGLAGIVQFLSDQLLS
jgi:ABC-type transporter Mla subunit MlaD